jgi:PHD/YefM family antitoxin component YafN of YafNO toxin-antitoxin module
LILTLHQLQEQDGDKYPAIKTIYSKRAIIKNNICSFKINFYMSATEIKKQLHTYIDMINDETKLAILNEAAEVYAKNQPDILDLLTPEQLDRLKESIQQANEGKTISYEEVKKLSREWLRKSTK